MFSLFWRRGRFGARFLRPSLVSLTLPSLFVSDPASRAIPHLPRSNSARAHSRPSLRSWRRRIFLQPNSQFLRERFGLQQRGPLRHFLGASDREQLIDPRAGLAWSQKIDDFPFGRIQHELFA